MATVEPREKVNKRGRVYLTVTSSAVTARDLSRLNTTMTTRATSILFNTIYEAKKTKKLRRRVMVMVSNCFFGGWFSTITKSGMREPILRYPAMFS